MGEDSRFELGHARVETRNFKSVAFRSGGRRVPTKRLFRAIAPFILFILMGPFAQTLFYRTLLSSSILCHSGQALHSKVPKHLVWSNTSVFRFQGPLVRTNFWLALCGLPIRELFQSICQQRQKQGFRKRFGIAAVAAFCLA